MKNSTKIFCAAAICAVLIAAGFWAGGATAQKNRLPASGFLQSSASVVQLGIWDKQGVAKSNRAIFTVTGANGKQFRAETEGALDDWNYVSFPNDFSPYPDSTIVFANYTWKATVDGKTVAGGNFKWGNGQADDGNRNLK